MTLSFFLAAVCGSAAAGFLLIYLLLQRIRQQKVDNADALRIASAIKLGAYTFLREEYKVISFVVLPVILLLAAFGSIAAAGCFLVGSLFSLLCGLIGMRAATDANVRTTMAAKDTGEHAAFLMAF